MQSIIITGNPVDGHSFYGPFTCKSDAVAWAEDNADDYEDWYVADLSHPLTADDLFTDSDEDDGDDPFGGLGYAHTHESKGDGSPAMFIRMSYDNVGVFANENGDLWEDDIALWRGLTPLDIGYEEVVYAPATEYEGTKPTPNDLHDTFDAIERSINDIKNGGIT